MATVLTISSPTAFRSKAIPLATTRAKLSTPVVQKQNAPASLTLEEKADKLLLKARSPMRVEEVRGVADALEKLLDLRGQTTLTTRRRCFRGLVRLCGEHGVLPESYLIPESKIEKLGDAPISTGGFSEVWPGIYEEEKPVAIKVIKYYSEGIQMIKKDFCREVITLKRLSHPNILELIGVIMNDESHAMVVPWMENGNILDYVREDPQTNPLKLLKDAALGLQYLHSMDLAHGDLKPENILIDGEGRAYLADVGLTRVAGDLSSTLSTSATSTTDGGFSVRWCPPELLDPERFQSKRGRPTKKSDIYSMAMTIYQVLTDKVPYHDCGDLPAMLRIIDGVRPLKPIFVITRGYTEDLWELTTRCWNQDLFERPPVDQVLEALDVAAEQWKPRLPSSPQDDLSPTLWAEESDSYTFSEPEDEHAATDPSLSPDSPRSPVIKTLVTATPSLPIPDEGLGLTAQAPPTLPSSGQLALQRLVSGVPSRDELPSLIETIVSNVKADDIVNHLRGSGAQTFVDVLSQALDDFDFPLKIRNECARSLYTVCAVHALLPKSMCLELPGGPSDDIRRKGGFGIVSKREYCGHEVAVKVLRPRGLSPQEMSKRFWKEVITWKVVRHENVLPLLGVAMAGGQFTMVSKWMANGNLKEFIKARHYVNRYELLADATKGLIYIHSQGMIHRDLKAANILVDPNGHACLADFGLLTIASDLAGTSSDSFLRCGTIRWMGPELFQPEKFGLTGRRRTKSSDCYALGMVIYEVLSGKVPFYQCGDVAAVRRILNGDRPERPKEGGPWFTDDIWNLLECCWEPMPDDRPSVEDVLHRLVETPMPSLAQMKASLPTMDPPMLDSDLHTEEHMERITQLLIR